MNQKKFRVWDNEEKVLIYNGCVGAGSACEFINIDFNGNCHLNNAFGFDSILGTPVTPPDRFILEQYVNRLDINKKEIWEGDIIKHGGSIRFIEFRGSNCLATRMDVSDTILLSFCDSPEVIGNIHENPELSK